MKILHQQKAGRKVQPSLTRTRTSYEEKVKIVNQLLEDKPNLDTRLKITKYTGYRSDVLNEMAEKGDVPKMPPKVANCSRHRWTNSLGTLSTKKYGR